MKQSHKPNLSTCYYRGCPACYYTGYEFVFNQEINLPLATDALCPACHGNGMIYIDETGNGLNPPNDKKERRAA